MPTSRSAESSSTRTESRNQVESRSMSSNPIFSCRESDMSLSLMRSCSSSAARRPMASCLWLIVVSEVERAFERYRQAEEFFLEQLIDSPGESR